MQLLLVNLDRLVQSLQAKLTWTKWVWAHSGFKVTTVFLQETQLILTTVQVAAQLVVLHLLNHISPWDRLELIPVDL
jgi:hypothetical protein